MPPKHAKKDHARAALIATARRSRITLVLGAGVSRGAGVPTWSELVTTLWREVFGVRALPPVEWVPLAYPQALELLARELGDAGFEKSLRGALYARFKRSSRAALRTSTSSLASVTRALLRDHGSATPRIARVVSFNVDDLLEQSLGSLAGSALVSKPIVRASQHPRGDGSAVSVYHLHGFLPQSPRARWHTHAADALVFTDAQYWASVAMPTSFPNRVMQFALHDSHCVFIGCSMTDLNVARWLSVHASEVAADKASQFAARPEPSRKATRTATQRALARHTWVRTRGTDREADAAGDFLSDWLATRGVQSVALPDWDALDALLREAFPDRRAARTRAR